VRKRLVPALLVIALLMVAGVGVLRWHRHQQRDEAAGPTCEQVTDLARALPEPAAQPSVAVLGDSYAEGHELPNRADAWPYLAFDQVTNDAIGGTGYINAGPCGNQAFATRADDVLATGARIIVVEGGLNDVAAEPAEVGDAAGALFRQLTAAGATVYAVGPAPAPARPADDVAAVEEALRQASTAAGVTYISAITWDLEYGPDDLHPTEEGQRDFATRVAEVVNAP
jgi:lysophospholipase L1-like esterase